uniref:Shikimate kinase II n=1 Tax=uncultured organism TaxID=155900 RepID=M1Q318_9ZZZZ|nr:shikimate kinase II [uncultured organism]
MIYMSDFVKKKVEVEDADLTTVHKHGEYSKSMHFDPEKMNVFFVGPRGSGKSTLAGKVAAELNNDYIDTDDLVVQRAGKSISDIVSVQGWESFRDLEHQVLKDVCSRNNCTVATGGGIVLTPENRELIKQCGIVFYLIADTELLYNRLKDQESDDSRPSLSELPLKEELGKSLIQRENYYLEITHYILQADKDVNELVKDVVSNL